MLPFGPVLTRLSRSRRSRARYSANWEARRTLRIEVAGQGYLFVKIHRGVGWKEILKNLLSLRLPVLGAGNEWRAIARLARTRCRYDARRRVRPAWPQSGDAAFVHRDRRTHADDQPRGLLSRLAECAAARDVQTCLDQPRGGHGRPHAPGRRQSSRFLHLPLPAASRSGADGRLLQALADRPASRAAQGADPAPLA